MTWVGAMALNIKNREAERLAHDLAQPTATGEPLLFKSDDFGHTDIAAAIASRT